MLGCALDQAAQSLLDSLAGSAAVDTTGCGGQPKVRGGSGEAGQKTAPKSM
jgi:hypothetical protein